MASIENRIVQMQFDNANFERKLSSTISSLDKLNASLANAGSKNGLEQIGHSANNINLSGLSSAIEGISGKWLAMATVAATVISNITTRALNAGIEIAKALSVDPLTDGFREYELQIGSIQTILANTDAQGTTLKQVNAALDELNTYSDKTIYNFGEMTKNIGTFTAAGVDLDTSVQSIKGIANLAAISGSNSQQASTAMYQLSQAMAAGTVKLMDWNSVVNAGMGGRVFQEALFETGKMMGTIADTPMDTTFDEWTKAGNTFRGSLEEGWLTGEVLTTTLKGFTGELTKAQIMSMGYSKEQAKEIMRLGELGVESATKVRTLKALIATTKEALGSGWAQSFELIFGDFEQATELFTNVSNAIGEMVGKSADARNELLKGWADLGGRTVLIDGLRTAFKALGEIFAPIKEAFREIFPPMTAERLFDITQGFRDFAEALRPSEATVENLKRIFTGLFGALEIGWEVIKQGTGFIIDLFKSVSGAGSGNFLDFFAKIGDFFTALNEKLVEGGGIEDFFAGLSEAVKDPIKFIQDLKDKVVDFFDELSSFDGGIIGAVIDRLGERFEGLRNIFDRLQDIWEPFGDALSGVGDILDAAWTLLKDWFGDLGSKLSEVMGPEDFDTLLDGVNIGLLAGLGLLIKKFVDKLNLGFGSGILSNMRNMFEEITGVFSAMQAEIKANALLKIAAAMGVMTASVILLATVDSAALTRALTAMAVGFGQLIGVFTLLNTVVLGPATAVKLAIVSAGLILLSAAMLVLAAAVKSLSSLSWGELLKGLLGVAGLLGVVVLAAGPLTKVSPGLIGAGIGLAALGVGLLVIAGAMKIFATMDFRDMAFGLYGVGASLTVVGLALKLMPPHMPTIGLGLLLIAGSLNLLALAVKQFSDLSFRDMALGLLGVGAGLTLIGLAMKLMPPHMPTIGVGLILVSGALLLISQAVQSFAGISWQDMTAGLIGIAGSLIVLGNALKLMSGTLAGAAALAIASASLMLLAQVVKEFAGIGWGDLIKGLVGIAAVLGILGLSAKLISPLIPALLGLSVALLLLGAGFALFGIGASLAAKAFELLAKVGIEGAKLLAQALVELSKALPEIMINLAEGVLEFARVILEAMPVIVQEIVKVIGSILTGVQELIPQILETVGIFISELLLLIVEKAPEFFTAGWALLTEFLRGFRDNIAEVVTLVSEIIVAFLDAFALEMPGLVTSLSNFLVTAFNEIAYELGLLVPTILIGVGKNLLAGLWDGMVEQLAQIGENILNLIQDIIDWFKSGFGIESPSTVMMGIGKDIILGLLNGIVNAAVAVTRWFIALPGRILGWIGSVARTLWNKGIDFIAGLLAGIVNKAVSVTNWFIALPGRILGWIGNVARTLWNKGIDFIAGLLAGIVNKAVSVTNWFINLPGKIVGWVGPVLRTLYQKGLDLILGFFNGILDKILSIISWLGNLSHNIVQWIGDLSDTLWDAGYALIAGLMGGIIEKAKDLWNWVTSFGGLFRNQIEGSLDVGSPSKMTWEIGRWVMEGLVRGLQEGSPSVLSEVDNIGNTLTVAMRQISQSLTDMNDINPTISPVLDLTEFKKKSLLMKQLMSDQLMVNPKLSYSHARDIASTRTREEFTTPDSVPTTQDISFEQNIYAPQQLSMSDIYRQTRNQIRIAKEELSIP